MKRYVFILIALAGAVTFAQRATQDSQTPPSAQGQEQVRGRGGRGAMTPEQREALAKQEALEKDLPQLQYDTKELPLVVPNHTIGETEGVAFNSQKHLFVFTRSGNSGPARGANASQLFEFDPTGRFVKEWAKDAYGLAFAHAVKVDKEDNVWVVDEGSSMVIKMNPQGRVTMVLGRKPEAIDYLERFLERGEKDETRFPVGSPNNFNRPTDVTWDTNGNIFVSDGYGNSRVAKFSKEGDWVKALGTHGNGPNQFSTPHAIASDAKGNIYVADRGNNRIQVFDPDLNPVRIISNVRSPWAICVTPGPTQYLYSADAQTGHIYKDDLEGKPLGYFGTTGKRVGQFYWVHQMACPSENEIYTGEAQNWRVQHVSLKPTTHQTSNGQ
ncbi:MAG TPA: peptidyl-alpha-hydroxyglycine alpha-amidating lyase family protein [Vicinamibacterales bacterium]|nr:peptidyl-alpha-hydroxyglycine alpha-amidating lyase family protein [Vicinamibacterales bacterium]